MFAEVLSCARMKHIEEKEKKGELALALAAVIQRRGLTQREAADITGLSVTYINHLLSGKRTEIKSLRVIRGLGMLGLDKTFLERISMHDQSGEDMSKDRVALANTLLSDRGYTRSEKQIIQKLKIIIERRDLQDYKTLDSVVTLLLQRNPESLKSPKERGRANAGSKKRAAKS